MHIFRCFVNKILVFTKFAFSFKIHHPLVKLHSKGMTKTSSQMAFIHYRWRNFRQTASNTSPVSDVIKQSITIFNKNRSFITAGSMITFTGFILFFQQLFASQQVMVMLGKAMGFVADILHEFSHRGSSGQFQRLFAAMDKDFFFTFSQ